MKTTLTALIAVIATTATTGADVFTVEKHDAAHPAGWAFYIGQTFRPEVQGIQGTGTAPDAPASVYLHSFQVYPWEASRDPEPLPDTAYIYASALMPLDADSAQAGVLSIAQALHAGNGIYEFSSPVEVAVDESYAFVLSEAASLLYWNSSPYEGGEAYWTNASTRGSNEDIQAFDTDIDFKAVFSTDGVIPEPASLVLLGLGGLALIRRAGSRK